VIGREQRRVAEPNRVRWVNLRAELADALEIRGREGIEGARGGAVGHEVRVWSLLLEPLEGALSDANRHNEEFDTGTYRAYVSRLPREFKDFPTSVNDEKLRVLIEERRVSFSIQNSDFLGDRINLKVLFAAKNIDAFLSGSPKLSVDDDFRMKLLSEDVSLNHKRAVVDQIDPNFVCAVGARASQIGPILDHTSFDPSLLGFDFLRAVIINSRPAHVQVSLLNKSHKVLNDDQVRSIILDLPDPYCDLAVFGKSPRLENIPINVSLADWLVQRRIVSSWRVSLTGEDVRVHTFRRQEAKL